MPARVPVSPRAGALVLAVVIAALELAGCGGQSGPAARSPAASSGTASVSSVRTTTSAPAPPPAPRPPVPALVVSPPRAAGAGWRRVASVHGRPAAWEAQRGGVTLLRFDQQFVRLVLHAGEGEPSGTWRYGAQIEPSEIHHVVAGFNGGFKFNTGVVGWKSGGRVAAPLRSGRGSIVTYRDGTTAIAAWHAGVPAAGRPVYSVLQNGSLLVDHGAAAENVEGCIQSCWGSTVGNVDSVARSGLGITGSGQLVWGAGESLLPATLAHGLIAAGAQRAVELDINPDWIAGYLYVHGGSGPSASPVVPGQHGAAGRYLEPSARDFFTVVAR
ncbi:MAG: hypothetical protein JWM60_1609 [Solirubrobacterales bacterium]|nr:hypothetical protein [Solirubrobacterales bacterium]